MRNKRENGKTEVETRKKLNERTKIYLRTRREREREREREKRNLVNPKAKQGNIQNMKGAITLITKH